MTLNASVEVSEAVDATVQRRGGGGDTNSRGSNFREVEQLKMQLTQSEKKQQETKATVLALRKEFMQLVDFMQGGQSKSHELPWVPSAVKDLDSSGKIWQQGMVSPQGPQHSPEAERPSSASQHSGAAVHAVTEAAKPRHGSQPVPSARRPIGSPRVYRTPGTFTTPRAGARPRGVHQRNGHSAGASVRQRLGGDVF